MVQVNHSRFLGYTKDADKKLVIDPAEAEVINRIYYEYLGGKSLIQIGRSLEGIGIGTAAGKAKWWPETFKKIHWRYFIAEDLYSGFSYKKARQE